METDLTLEEMLRRIVDHIGGELAHRAASICGVDVLHLSAELTTMEKLGAAYATYATCLADLADDPTRSGAVDGLWSIEPHHAIDVLRVGSMTPQEGYAAWVAWSRRQKAAIMAMRASVRECEICGERAQPMGTEPRCVAHDSEGGV